jgi:hypothetical protein
VSSQKHFSVSKQLFAWFIPLRNLRVERRASECTETIQFKMLIRLLLFIALLVCAGVNLFLSNELIDEVEQDLPMNERPSLQLLINQQAYFWRAIRHHRLRYPASRLRRKVIMWDILTGLNFLGFLASLAWSISWPR